MMVWAIDDVVEVYFEVGQLLVFFVVDSHFQESGSDVEFCGFQVKALVNFPLD